MHNKNFTLSIVDIDNIEKGLRDRLSKLSTRRLSHVESTIKPEKDIKAVKKIDEEMKSINQTLGNIHNQKIFWNTTNRSHHIL